MSQWHADFRKKEAINSGNREKESQQEGFIAES